jgi:hypothetical protein
MISDPQVVLRFDSPPPGEVVAGWVRLHNGQGV